MILAGDLGGTKSNLGLFDVQREKLVRVAHERFASSEHSSLEEIMTLFLGKTGAKITHASFGVAGPVVNNRVRGTNLPWVVDGALVAKHLGLSYVRLLNDLEATAYGIEVLDPQDIETIHTGVAAPQATQVVIAAGTGLGEGVLFWDGNRRLPLATESGHSDYSPNTAQHADLWKFIKQSEEFVSAESILSGRGFSRIHKFLNPSVRHAGFDDPSVDPAPEITRLGLSGECAVCVATLDLWVEIYGSEAGNLALRNVARGGIYIAGGIAVKILPKLKSGRFAASVKHKEKLSDFLAQIPIHVILNEECPLIGAANVAWKNL
ncbi:MAG TPA: glucokinase [Candidatus Acidoferrales bacterium]|nr:glucokinase [Candidatus Acidoferrales bacterium]